MTLYSLYPPRNSHLVFTCFNEQNCSKQNSPPAIVTVGCKPGYLLCLWKCFLISMHLPHRALLPLILPGNLSSIHVPNNLITVSKSSLRQHLLTKSSSQHIAKGSQTQPAPMCSFPNCDYCAFVCHIFPKNTSSSDAAFSALVHILEDIIMWTLVMILTATFHFNEHIYHI